MCLYSHGILPNVKFPSLKFETNTCIARLYSVKITCLLLYIFVCSAALYIPGDDFIFEKDTPLLITCVNAKNESNINFKFDNDLLGTCYSKFGCNTLGNTFTLSAVTSTSPREYFLKSVHNFDTTLCGTYQCTDIDDTRNQDSVNVSYKEFNTNSFLVEETDDALNISIACVFPASFTDLEVSWFIFDNSSLRRLNLTSDNGFITVVTATSGCPDVTCNNISAKSFQFGLKFNNHSERFFSVFVEIKIVHTLFPDKPLVWRSSKAYLIEENEYVKHFSSPTQHADLSVGSIIGIVGGVVAFVLIMAVVICIQLRNKRKRSNDVRRGKNDDVSTLKRPENTETESEKTENDIGVIKSENETGRCVPPFMADGKRHTAVSVVKAINADTARGKSNHHETDTNNFNSKHSETDPNTPNSNVSETGTDMSIYANTIAANSDIDETYRKNSNSNNDKPDAIKLKLKYNEAVKQDHVIGNEVIKGAETCRGKSKTMKAKMVSVKFKSKHGSTGREKITKFKGAERSKDFETLNHETQEVVKLIDGKTVSRKSKSKNSDTARTKSHNKATGPNNNNASSHKTDNNSANLNNVEVSVSNPSDDETDIENSTQNDQKTDTDTLDVKDSETYTGEREDVIRSDSEDDAEPGSCNSIIVESKTGSHKFKSENSKTGFEGKENLICVKKSTGFDTICIERQDVKSVDKSMGGQIGKLNNDEIGPYNESTTNRNNYEAGNENSNQNGNKADTDISMQKDNELETVKVENVIGTKLPMDNKPDNSESETTGDETDKKDFIRAIETVWTVKKGRYYTHCSVKEW
ncbi:uncharacterized protein DDB_G0292186-like [Mya arenaria]|uniref:uncharacterized protein DDB_G0292186-like n=1 Tax=Mya arenaria TaxID=6604 RepID=UPI0022E934A3|nr:uncharacterized protein DDB_G0292186-like [Mya arenaria]